MPLPVSVLVGSMWHAGSAAINPLQPRALICGSFRMTLSNENGALRQFRRREVATSAVCSVPSTGVSLPSPKRSDSDFGMCSLGEHDS